MKFSTLEFRIKQPVSRSLIVAVVLCVVSAVGAGYFAFAASSSADRVSVLEKKLAAAEGSLSAKTKELADSDKTNRDRIKTIKDKADLDISALNDKIAAFAKQAAACEVLRKKIGR